MDIKILRSVAIYTHPINAVLRLIHPTKTMAAMHLIKLIFRYGFLVLAAYGCASQASPINKTAGSNPDLLQPYVWYDGQQKKTVWLNPGLIAEFGYTSAGKSLLQKKYPAASVRRTHRSIRIWHHKTQPFTAAPLNSSSKSTAQTQAKYSPVFHDTSKASGSLRSLPGNIIVYLRTDWNQDKIRHWLEKNGYEVVKKLDVRINAFVLKTEPGIKALQQANALYESGEVVAAFPDWWLESAMR